VSFERSSNLGHGALRVVLRASGLRGDYRCHDDRGDDDESTAHPAADATARRGAPSIYVG
jgi:hypothetical protein